MTATVLLVEDERKLRELVRSYLERAGLAVLSTSSGAEAITLAASAAPDLVVLDLGPRELVLRVQAILRRGTPVTTPGPVSYGAGTLLIDTPRRQVVVRGAPADLTPTEWGILGALATVAGRVYSRFELINRVRGYEFEGY